MANDLNVIEEVFNKFIAEALISQHYLKFISFLNC